MVTYPSKYLTVHQLLSPSFTNYFSKSLLVGFFWPQGKNLFIFQLFVFCGVRLGTRWEPIQCPNRKACKSVLPVGFVVDLKGWLLAVLFWVRVEIGLAKNNLRFRPMLRLDVKAGPCPLTLRWGWATLVSKFGCLTYDATLGGRSLPVGQPSQRPDYMLPAVRYDGAGDRGCWRRTAETALIPKRRRPRRLSRGRRKCRCLEAIGHKQTSCASAVRGQPDARCSAMLL